MCFSLVFGLRTDCIGLLVLPVGVISRLCSVTVALPGHLLY